MSALALVLLPALLAAPAREPVLKQVQVPHSYYWREMYVPQVTGGPTAAAWSPDGTELVYAMAGTLWRQKVGSDEASEITSGPGADHQPDWSPDGRWIVHASYRDDAISLRVLDLSTGRDEALLADGNVNLEPRFSPDGHRLAWVSTAYQGRWHVFVADFADGRLGTPGRITEDVDSGLPRYYYSRFDHYLSPTWSPDGRELILVSNRGRVWGTGGFWRMEAQPGAPMRALWNEETTWKARPDWSRDGRRVVYSSYHGRNWGQLWLTTAGGLGAEEQSDAAPMGSSAGIHSRRELPDGGAPFALTYGEFDATAPRFSPDGARIAYVTNEGGQTALAVIEVPGGRRIPVQPRVRHHAAATGVLRVTVQDAAGHGVPARLSVQDAAGWLHAPDGAWRHADEMFVRGERAVEYGYFHADAPVEVTVPAGTYTVQAWHGPEWSVGNAKVDVAAGASVPIVLALDHLVDEPARGYWGGDVHVHMNYGGAYRNTPTRLARDARAEGLHVVEDLVVNKEQRVPDVESWSTRPDPVSTDDFLFLWAQEFHTSWWGHIALLGLRDHLLLPDYAGYAVTAASSLEPTNGRVHDLGKAQGAISGYVHPYDTPPDPADRATPLTHGLPLDVALGKVDYLEVMGFSDHRATADIWYRLLNCGFRIPAAGGTDAFPNFASLRGPAGLVRTYAHAGARLTPDAFHDAIRAGRTFATNGPLLSLSIDGHEPGDVITLPARGGRLTATVSVVSNVPVDHVELVRNGTVVSSVALTAGGTRASASIPLSVKDSGWYVLRTYADRPRDPILDLYPYATTSPLYVEVAGRPMRGGATVDYFLAWLDRIDQGLRAWKEWNTDAEREGVLSEVEKARAVFKARR